MSNGEIHITYEKLLLSNKNQFNIRSVLSPNEKCEVAEKLGHFYLNNYLFLYVFVKNKLTSYNFRLSRVFTNSFIYYIYSYEELIYCCRCNSVSNHASLQSNK